MLAIAADWNAGARRERAVVLDDALQRFPGQIEPVEFGIAVLERGNDPQGLGVVIETAMRAKTGVERALAGMAERRMAEVMRQRKCLGQIFVEPELAGKRAGDLGNFQRVGQTRSIV